MASTEAKAAADNGIVSSLELDADQAADAALATIDRFSDDVLRSLKSVDDVMALMTTTYGRVDSIDDFELGNGFKIVREDEKRRLIGEPFIVLAASYHMGEWNEFVSMLLFCQRTGDKLILNDGGAGLPGQIRDLIRESGRPGAWSAPRGLRVSDYKTCVGKVAINNSTCGRPRPQNVAKCESCADTSEARGTGATFYLDIS